MTLMEEMAAAECRAAHRLWETGGTDLYAPEIPKRPRPPREPVMGDLADHVDEIPAFDEALEHVNWCRSQGQSPQCVADSIGVHMVVATWSLAVSLVEDEIHRMRALR